MWRQKDTMGLMKVWKGAVVASERRMSKAKARRERGDKSRIERAIRLLRHGAISRAGKALESMGLGDFEDPEVWNQIEAKHSAKKRRIRKAAYQYRSDEEIHLKVGKFFRSWMYMRHRGHKGSGTLTCAYGRESSRRSKRTRRWSI